jgi:hypothetical protein
VPIDEIGNTISGRPFNRAGHETTHTACDDAKTEARNGADASADHSAASGRPSDEAPKAATVDELDFGARQFTDFLRDLITHDAAPSLVLRFVRFNSK